MGKANELLNHAVQQGKTFLTEFGEFFPYASVLKTNGNVVAYSLYAEEVDDIVAYANELKRLLQTDLADGKIEGYCMGVDVRSMR